MQNESWGADATLCGTETMKSYFNRNHRNFQLPVLCICSYSRRNLYLLTISEPALNDGVEGLDEERRKREEEGKMSGEREREGYGRKTEETSLEPPKFVVFKFLRRGRTRKCRSASLFDLCIRMKTRA